MIRELVRIERVDQGETKQSRIPQYLIAANTVNDPVTRMLHIQTVSAWQASLCKTAIESRKALWITWADRGYGKDLVNVEPAS